MKDMSTEGRNLGHRYGDAERLRRLGHRRGARGAKRSEEAPVRDGRSGLAEEQVRSRGIFRHWTVRLGRLVRAEARHGPEQRLELERNQEEGEKSRLHESMIPGGTRWCQRVERMGFEPTTPWLQTRCSPS